MNHLNSDNCIYCCNRNELPNTYLPHILLVQLENSFRDLGDTAVFPDTGNVAT